MISLSLFTVMSGTLLPSRWLTKDCLSFKLASWHHSQLWSPNACLSTAVE